MSSQYFWDRIAGRDPNVRAADADRERVAEQLRKGHGEGRLDLTEFQERLERCYESKTLGELDTLVRDLPRQDELAERRTAGVFGPWHWRLGLLAPIVIALLFVSAVSGHHHDGFWLWIPVLFIFWRISHWRRRRRWAASRRGWGDWI